MGIWNGFDETRRRDPHGRAGRTGCVALAEVQFGRWVLAPAVLLVLPLWSSTLGHLDAVVAVINELSGVVGVLVAVGCFIHCLGDSLTTGGCPWLFPVLIRGETWFEIRAPAWLRFRTNSLAEHLVTWGVFAPLATVLIPGVWPTLAPQLAELATRVLPT